MRVSLSLPALLLLACLAVFSTSVRAYVGTYDPVFSKHMLDLAGATYCHPSQVAAWNCAFCKEETTFQLTGAYNNATSNMQVLVGYAPQYDTIVVAFKGTSPTSIKNWLQDLTYEFLAEECPECSVHRGFYQTYLSVRSEALGLMAKARAKYPGASLTVTGHSLGGALTNIAAVDFQVTMKELAATVISFGQPRVGNPAFAQFYNQTFEHSQSWRVTHYQDPVPHVPPQSFGYQHHAFEIYYNCLNTAWQVCSASGEDPKCANQHDFFNPLDHGTYLGADFMEKFVECQVYTEANGGSVEVNEPERAPVEMRGEITVATE